MGKERRIKSWPTVKAEKEAPVTETVLRTSGVGTQLRDPINSGLIRWQLTVDKDAVAESGRNSVNKLQVEPGGGE